MTIDEPSRIGGVVAPLLVFRRFSRHDSSASGEHSGLAEPEPRPVGHRRRDLVVEPVAVAHQRRGRRHPPSRRPVSARKWRNDAVASQIVGASSGPPAYLAGTHRNSKSSMSDRSQRDRSITSCVWYAQWNTSCASATYSSTSSAGMRPRSGSQARSWSSRRSREVMNRSSSPGRKRRPWPGVSQTAPSAEEPAAGRIQWTPARDRELDAA